MLTRAYIALGSNLKNPLIQINTAIDEIDALPDVSLQARSSLYQSTAIGPGNQPDYLNAVIGVDTCISPFKLLTLLQGIETAHGRVRNLRWEPRTLDLDILLFGNQCITAAQLTVPHPEMLKRNFVLYPLHEIAPMHIFPDGRSCAEITALQAKTGLLKLDDKTIAR